MLRSTLLNRLILEVSWLAMSAVVGPMHLGFPLILWHSCPL
jgi:hypothetical protein